MPYPEGFYITAKIICPWLPSVEMEVKVLGTSYSEVHKRNITRVESLDERLIFSVSAGYMGGYAMSSTIELFTDKIIEVIVRDVDGNEIDNLGKPPGKDVPLTPTEQYIVDECIVDNGQEVNPHHSAHLETDEILEWMEA